MADFLPANGPHELYRKDPVGVGQIRVSGKEAQGDQLLEDIVADELDFVVPNKAAALDPAGGGNDIVGALLGQADEFLKICKAVDMSQETINSLISKLAERSENN